MTDVIDRLIRLAGGDVDVVQRAIHRAADGKPSAPLLRVVELIVQDGDAPPAPNPRKQGDEG